MRMRSTFATAGQGIALPQKARTAAPRPMFWLTGLTIFILIVISSMVLTRFGIHYDLQGGMPLEKIHPAHFLAMFVLMVLWLSHTRPMEFVDRLFVRHKGTMFFLVTWVLLLFQIVVVQSKPFTPIIDTFIMPIVMLFVLTSMDEHGRFKLARLLHLLMFANGLLALAEFAFGFRLTPLDAGGVIIEGDWRASALLGHPLTNALLTGCYLIVFSLGGGRDLPWILRPLVFGISLLAMNAFGGRMALVSLLGFLGVVYGLKMIAPLHGAVSSRRNWLLGVLLVPLGIMALVVGFETGLFDQMLERFVNDKGSASARVYMFEVFRDLNWLDIMIGPDQEYVASLLRAQGVNFGIESFWIAFILSYGFIVSMVFFVGLFAFLYDVVRVSALSAAWPILYFLTVSSTSVSLSAKGTDLAILVIFILLLLPKKKRAVARASRAPLYKPEHKGDLSWV